MIKKTSLVVALLIAGVQAIGIYAEGQTQLMSRSSFSFRDIIDKGAEKVNKIAGGEKDKLQAKMDDAKKTVDDQREKVGGMDEVHSFLE